VRVDAVKLRRRVEMYQWEEERQTREFKGPDMNERGHDVTTYTY
jgi:hypothetical protein